MKPSGSDCYFFTQKEPLKIFLFFFGKSVDKQKIM